MRSVSSRITHGLDQAGQFLFGRRNVLFPLALCVLIIALRPRRLDDALDNWFLALGLLCLALGQGLRVVTIGLDYIKRGGKGGRIYANRLVTGGIYRHTRNPMYAGNLLIVLGWLLVAGNLLALAIGVVAFCAAYHLIMRSEERYLLNTFGGAYEAYRVRTPRWLPRLNGLVTTVRSYRFDWPAVIVKEYGTIFSTLMIATAIIAYKAMLTNVLELHWVWYLAIAALWVALYIVARYLKKVVELKPRGATLVSGAIELERKRLDVIDASILDLLNERAQHVDAVFEIKRCSGMPRFDGARTEQILQRLKSLNQGPLTDQEVESIFRFILRHFAFEHAVQGRQGEIEVETLPRASALVHTGELA